VSDTVKFDEYDHRAGDWGSVKALTEILTRELVAIDGGLVLLH